MTIGVLGRSWTRAVSAALVAALALVVPAARAAREQTPLEVREAITDLLQKRVNELLGKKDPQGHIVGRGYYSRDFRTLDDATYLVTFFRAMIDKDTEKVERLLLTIKRGSDGKWAVAKEEVKDTYDGRHRGSRDEDAYFRFDKLAFDRHGMKVTATNGSLFETYYMGKLASFTVAADDLAYEFAPPKNLGYYQTYNAVILREYRDRFVFDPYQVSFSGDADSCEAILASAVTGLKKVSRGETSSRLQSAYDDFRKRWDSDLETDGFRGLRRPFLPERKTWNVSVKRSGGEERWIWIDYDNDEPWDVQFGASDPGFEGRPRPYTIFGWYSSDVLAATPSAADLDRREDRNAHEFELDSLTGSVEMGIEDADTLTGDLTYGITIKRTIREIPFDISRTKRPGDQESEVRNPRFKIDYVGDGDGNEWSWLPTSAYGGMVLLPKPLPAGTKLTLKIRYTNSDCIYKLNPSYSYVDRDSWLPFIRSTDPIEKFDLTVKVPAKYIDLGVGRKESETKQGSVLVTRWTADAPIWFPTVIFGDYVSDKSSIKATKSDGTEIPVNIYVDRISTQGDIRQKQLQPLADQAANALNLYRAVYGVDYPFAKLDLVNTPQEFGGGALAQSPDSMIYVLSMLFRGEGTLGTFGGSDLSKLLKDTVPHETGHQWWGSLIGNVNERSYWFVESLAEYSAAIFVENVYGPKKYDEKVEQWRRELLKWDNLTSVADASVLWGGEFPGQAYISNVYLKGPYAFHILRRTFGDDKFFAFLKRLATELKGKQIVTRDIQRVAEESFGGTMEWFFNEWFRGVGLPQYSLYYDVKQTEDGKWLVDGRIRQRVIAGKTKAELPGVFYKSRGWLTFEFEGGKEMKYPARPKSPGEQERMFVVDGAETPFKVKLPEKPIAVYFNKDGEILAQDVLVNQSW